MSGIEWAAALSNACQVEGLWGALPGFSECPGLSADLFSWSWQVASWVVRDCALSVGFDLWEFSVQLVCGAR